MDGSIDPSILLIRARCAPCYTLVMNQQAQYVWDYNITQEQFDALLDGNLTIGRLDRNWAAVRLIEWAPYREMIQRIGYRELVEGWPQWRGRLRSEQQRRSLDFVVAWLPGIGCREHGGSVTMTEGERHDCLRLWHASGVVVNSTWPSAP